MSLTDTVYQIADELRSIANMGLRYSNTPFDKERYERILSASARLVADLEGRAEEDVLKVYQDNMGHISPNSGSEAVVVRDGKILLIQRGDNGLWAIPGGLVDVGEPVAATAQRELWEEAHLEGKVTRLLGFFDSLRWRTQTKVQLYFVTFQVDAPDGTPSPAPPETLDVGFFAEDELPPLSPGHDTRMSLIFKQIRGEAPVPYYDLPK